VVAKGTLAVHQTEQRIFSGLHGGCTVVAKGALAVHQRDEYQLCEFILSFKGLQARGGRAARTSKAIRPLVTWKKW
jgi:hypothetical protein